MTVMEYVEYKTKKVPLDDAGYLVNFDDWDEGIAEVLAEREGVGKLTPEKLDALKFIREYFQKYNFFPILGAVCKKVHLPKDCVSEAFLNPLLAWKIAGLPRPEEPVISLLEAGQSPG